METVEKTEEEQQKWDTERQRADQAEAVAQKAREEAQSYAEELGETRAKLQQMESQLETFRKETQSEKDALAKMDDTLIDQNVITNVQKLDQRDAAIAQEVDALKKELLDLKAEREQRVHERAVSEAREAVLGQCDEEFSPKYRTEALRIADELVDSGKEQQPNDRFSGYILMKKCYKQVADKEASKTKTTVATDSGSGGVSHKTETRKTGSLDEVVADMKKDNSWKSG